MVQKLLLHTLWTAHTRQYAINNFWFTKGLVTKVMAILPNRTQTLCSAHIKNIVLILGSLLASEVVVDENDF